MEEVEKQGKLRGDSFVIEDLLLDLPNEEQEDAGMVASEYGSSETLPEFSCTDSSTVATIDSCINSVSRAPGCHFSGELICYGVADGDISSDLSAPYGDLTDLEWLSNFVEESFSSEDIQNLQLISAPKSASSSASPANNPPFFRPEAPVPGKARSKRSRTVQCNWSSQLLLLSSAPESSPLDPRGDVIGQSSSGKKAAMEPSPATTADVRKCLHCETNKTPQWRMGPLGPKTLCNACGVRFKSGRLMPEYRPVASPTFILSKHSNSHRKVLELRRQSELQQSKFLVRDEGGALLRRSAAFAGDDFLIRHDLGADSRLSI
ncbi:GATA transcription factor 12 [Platanthera zijinensis]|uniref:GATA transcription factor n=1 Tax=Platanthera zijinensis TaxID=2320716 RepID=A0AAP0BUB7_9ASPA